MTLTGYFSPDGGTTNLGAFNTIGSGDAGDWDSSVPNDPFDAFASPGVSQPVSANDITVMDAIGWNLTGSSVPSATVPVPSGVTIFAVTSALAGVQGTSALTGKGALATIVETGGLITDAFTYTLAGSGAGSFTLSTVNSEATLSAGNSNVAGAASGRLYALTVTVNDTTAGKSSAAFPADVVVGVSGGDTIQLATLIGALAAATPTFVYGLGGNDTILGTGMTGPLTIAGGAGADTLTGGSGSNTYVYGAVAESTQSAMDIITNFQVAVDLIDLTGLGVGLTYASQAGPAATTLAAHSVNWQISGANTLVFVNTSAAAESLSATDMKIELLGAVPLTTANIVHL
ncbi:MAG: hypothetical protein EXR07_11630 [Acetobacteraceae bacterium]|nr:hypothetical protein [Acetobacteraceae bacterium]